MKKMNSTKILIMFLLTPLLTTQDLFAKNGHGGQGGQDGQVTQNICDMKNTTPHQASPYFSFKTIKCSLKEYYSKKETKSCGNLGTRVIYLENCEQPAITHPTNDYSWIKNGIALTTTYPGICYSEAGNQQIDNMNFELLPIGTEVTIDIGETLSMGKGAGPGFGNDVHRITVANKSICTTDHGVIKDSLIDIHADRRILFMVNPLNKWIKE